MITFSETQLLAWLMPILWPFLRIISMMAVLPIFNKRNVPNKVKVGLAIFAAVAMQATLPPMPSVSLDSSLAFMIIIQQIVIGLTIGFAVRLVFACIEFAGELIGMKMGLNFAGFFDPVTAAQGTVATTLFSFMIAWTFITINGHLLIFQAISYSFKTFPVGTTPWEFLTKVRPWEWGIEIFRIGFWVALPLVTVLMFLNLLMGVISRVAPSVQIFSVGIPFTLGIGLLGIWFLIPSLERPFTFALEKILKTLS